MQGTVALTDHRWYEFLLAHPELEEVNFWRPSARATLLAEPFSPFLFKLKKPRDKICGFGWFARYTRLPDWLAWEVFGIGNGSETLDAMRDSIRSLRRSTEVDRESAPEIGCVLLSQPLFFPSPLWVDPPRDWPLHVQTNKRYDLASGEGRRVWEECQASALRLDVPNAPALHVLDDSGKRLGTPRTVTPRLGQGAFRIAVSDAYGRACAVTGEHSLPALEAAHIHSFRDGGPNEVSNGILLRADLHRLFDRGYVTVTDDYKFQVSRRLATEWRNGRSYYPLDDRRLQLPDDRSERPDPRFLRWHRETRYVG